MHWADMLPPGLAAAGAMVALAVVVGATVPPEADRCGPRAEILERLGGQRVLAGGDSAGVGVEILADAAGRWTLLGIEPAGRACILIRGTGLGLAPSHPLYGRRA